MKHLNRLPERLPRGSGLARRAAALCLALTLALIASLTLGADRASASSCAHYHTVQRGQNLSSIAVYYGINMYTVARANGIYNTNHVYSGQRLCIPGGYYQPVQQPTYNYSHYTVRHGDSLSKIALHCGVSTHALARANGIRNENHIYVGQVLKVPATQAPPPPPVYKPHPTPAPPPVVHPTPAPKPVEGAWTGVYYNNRDFSGPPVFTRQDAHLNFDYGSGSPAEGIANDHFSILWTKSVYFHEGTYRFFVTVDDGARLYVDNHLVLDAFRVQPATSYFVDVYIPAGHHNLRLEYFEDAGVASVKLEYAKL